MEKKQIQEENDKSIRKYLKSGNLQPLTERIQFCEWIPQVIRQATLEYSYESFVATHFLKLKENDNYNFERLDLQQKLLEIE